jgi:hypothetical protein
MDAGAVSPLLKGNVTEVDEDVKEIGRNLPSREKSKIHQRRITTNVRPTNNELSVRNTNRFKTLPTGSNIKGNKQTRQPDSQPILKKKKLVVKSSDRGRIVDLASQQKVTEQLEKIEQLFKYVNNTSFM